MFTFSEMLALVESQSSFGAYVCHRRPGGSIATSDLVAHSLRTVLNSHHHKLAPGTLLTFSAFPERSEYLGTEPTPSVLPYLIICHGLVSFRCLFFLTIDLRGREAQCKRNQLILWL